MTSTPVATLISLADFLRQPETKPASEYIDGNIYSPWIASKFQVRDLSVLPDTWFDQYQEGDGVAIDRDTETAADGKLYDFQVVPANTQFQFRAIVENAEDWELGLLMIGLHQFETEQIPLGGGRSRGLGVVKLDISEMWWLDVNNNPVKLLTYLTELVNSKIGDKLPSYQEGKDFKDIWTQALIKHLRDNIPKILQPQSKHSLKEVKMAFSNYKTIGEVLKAFQVTYIEANFISGITFNIPDYFREDLELMMRDAVIDNSEFAICENLIYPVLKEVWKTYRQHFVLWSHESLNYDEKLSGFPEYILAKRSPLGKIVFDKPYFILVEAKQDNFETGWAQCLAEMIAAQRLNGEYQIIIFGIVSNGATWQFGKLDNEIFTKNSTYYTIQELDKLFAVVNFVFQQSELQLNNLVLAAA